MVVVYGKNNCQSCVAAKSVLETCGVKYDYINCDEDFDAFDKMVELGLRSFPQLFLNGSLIAGGFKGLQKLKETDTNLDLLK